MKKLLNGIILVILVPSLVMAWEGEIVFEDNFTGDELDRDKWEYQEGCGNTFGDRLNCNVKDNVQVTNGYLVITAKEEKLEDKDYTSGRIRQKGAGYARGAFVSRAKLARGDHLWPAIWLQYSNSSCRYEEIDIMEYRGQSKEARNSVMSAHWGRDHTNLTSVGVKKETPVDLSLDYHEYAILWTPEKIEWYIDDLKYHDVSLTDGAFIGDPDKLPCLGEPVPFTERAKLIINMAVGGSFFSQYPPIDPSTWRKPTMEVDWIRVYQ